MMLMTDGLDERLHVMNGLFSSWDMRRFDSGIHGMGWGLFGLGLGHGMGHFVFPSS